MRVILFLVIALILAGCAVQESVHTKDGKEYGTTGGQFRDRWWSYYERGLSFAEGEFYEEAVQDLRAAIEQRKDDQWRSRTYGMHLIDYFPHRELGIVYFELKQFDNAVRELEHSLSTAESAKAKYFLNKTRKSILEQTGKDKLSPSISIDYPPDGTITGRTAVALHARAEDDYYVSSFFVNDMPSPLELSAKNITLEREVGLRKGINEIRVRVSDLTGKTTEKIITINSDTDGPVIIIEEQVKDGSRVILSGLVTDSTEITSFMINGQSVPLNTYEESAPAYPGQEMAFTGEVDLPEETGTITLQTTDSAMNVTRGELQVTQSNSRLQHLPLLASSSPAGLKLDRNEYAFNGLGLGRIIDGVPPNISLKGLADSQTVYTDSIYLEGRVSDESRITSLAINGEQVLRRKGKIVFFNYLAALREGENRFHIEAADTFGNRSERELTVHRKVPKIRRIGSRMSMSVLPFDRKGAGSIAGDSVFDGLISALVDQKRFHLVERQRMEEVLRELRLGQRELADPRTASKIGKIIAADAILMGTIYETDDTIEVFTRLVDTETSDIMDAQDVFDEGRSLPGIKRLMEGLAAKYRESFPLLEGLVIKRDGKDILTDIGEEKKIKKNMGLILFREGDKIVHPLSEKTLGSEPVELGEAKIDEIYNEFSRAIITRGNPANVRTRDKIITK